MTIEVVKPGLLATLQDAGRPGFAHLGIGRTGAFDGPALRIANALCGNPRDACTLETTLLGPTLRFHADAWIAVTGAPASFRIDGTDQPAWAPVFAAAGTMVELGPVRSGCRSYLAVRGGFDVAPVLGSRSTDVNGRIGPFADRPLRAGDALEMATTIRPAPSAQSRPINWRLDPRPWLPEAPLATLRLLPGSHFDRMEETSRNLLFSATFKVQADSNRTGLRLSGPKLEFREPVEMVSEGSMPGTLQLPLSGQPIAFGPEGPVSGGYPRIGQVAAVDIPRLAQLRPGDALRFVSCAFDDALCALRERERALARLETSIAARLTA
jgi:antagonist of KipI